MDMVEKEKDLIGFAHKVITFRMNVFKECKKRGIEVPSDDKISEYINGYGFHLDDFIADYVEKEGIFRDPTDDFYNDLMKMNWGENTPTIEEVKTFVTANGYNKDKFVNEHVLNSYKGIVKKTLVETLKLSNKKLVTLWNTFVEESSLYGEDSYIYDLQNDEDLRTLQGTMDRENKKKIVSLVANEKARFIQWFSLNDGSIHVKKDIKGIIIAYWGEIFERIMLFPLLYQFKVEKYEKGDGSTYFDDVFFIVIADELGYVIDGSKGTIVKKG